MTIDGERLIERAFCLKQASLDSVHEKNVRHGHISTLHIWPARRPLAACRAALIATLLPDPGSAEERRRLLERLGGRVVQKVEKKKRRDGRMEERIKEETHGGILHWGREDSPDLGWFRAEIKKAYGGRAPRVLDPFAGGGAIPLEAMRLGCEVTAVDINPVAWFILKCTLEYPQKLAGKLRPLPEFVLADEEFMAAFRKANPEAGGPGRKGEGQLELTFAPEDAEPGPPEADLAWHVRAWGRWVLARARRDLARYYPVYAAYEPLKPAYPHERRELKPVSLKKDGTPDVAALNAEFSPEYLADGRNPRWVAKSTVAYLWARTVRCKNCRAEVPLLKTRWLCKKDRKRVLLTLEPNAKRTGVTFGIQTDVPQVGANAAQRWAHDKKIGAGTMSRSGATCPCCGAIMTMEDIRLEGQAGRLGAVMTTVVVDGLHGKEYRLPTPEEINLAAAAQEELERVYAEIPFGLPEEPLPGKEALGFRVPLYGFDRWYKLFTPRQLLALGTFVKHTRAVEEVLGAHSCFSDLAEAVLSYLGAALDRMIDRMASTVTWDNTRDGISHVFHRFALPIIWDFGEANPFAEAGGGYFQQLDWVSRCLDYAFSATRDGNVRIMNESATYLKLNAVDVVVTDPPYYDAIPYSDLMDFFYVWLRRTLHGLSPEIDEVFREPLAPKWDHEKNDGELIDDASRHGGDKVRSKAVYEEGMFRAFQACYRALTPEGRLVIVFAHKQPDAWETLVSAIIRAGFVVDASWPIQTEMGNRTRALSSAALSSSVWLVCRKRPAAARPGWDNQVLAQMRELLYGKWDEERKEWLSPPRLHEYWDAGIRGPDFVWAATGPALAAYSKYPVVKKANEPGQVMTVSEFLRAVRRLVVDFVVGRVLSQNGEATVSALDDVTTYYLLHRHDFGLEEVPAGACILYAVSCGLSDRDLADQYDLIVRTGGQAADQETVEDEGEEDPGEEDEPGKGSGSTVKLKPWQQRKRKSLGFDAEGRPAPLIDQVHRLMHLWKAGDVVKVDDYLDRRGLRRNYLYHQLLQALIELAKPGSEERSLLESISNHVAARGAASGQEEIFVSAGT